VTRRVCQGVGGVSEVGVVRKGRKRGSVEGKEREGERGGGREGIGTEGEGRPQVVAPCLL